MKQASKDNIKGKSSKIRQGKANPVISLQSTRLGSYQPLIICLLAFLIYSNSLFLGYALDDRLVITENKFTQAGLKGLKDIFTTDSFVGFFGKQNTLLEGGRYRPLSIATFALEKSVFGKSPAISHLINILLYTLTCLLIFIILKMILKNVGNRKWYASLPFLIAILYTVHPLHTEVVTNIKGRDELLSFLGSLFTLYFILKYISTEKIQMLIYAACSYTLAMLSKENTVTFMAAIPLTMFFFTKAKPKHYLISLGIMFFGLIIFFILRYHALGFMFSNNFVSTELLNNPFLYATPSQKYATIILTWGIYLKLLLLPHPLTHDYYPKQIAIVGFSDVRVIIMVFIVLFAVGYAIYKFRKKDMISFGILFFIITFSISSNLLINIGSFMNERFMYVSSLGFMLIVVYLLDKLSIGEDKRKTRQPKLVLSIFFMVIMVFSIKTFARNFAWKDDYTLFTTDVKTSANSAKCNVSAGGQTLEKRDLVKDENIRRQMLGDAMKYLQKGVEIHPKYVQGWILFGNACLKNDDFNNGLACYQNALNISPGAPDVIHNIQYAAHEASKKKFYNESIKAYRILAGLNKNNEVFLIEIADCLIKKGNADSSLKLINILLDSPKPSYLVYSKAGEIWGRYLNNPKNALNYLLKAHELNPGDLSVNENLGIVYAMMSNYTLSLFYFDQCLKKEPDNPRILQNVALTYSNMGQKEKAAEYTKKAQSLPPQPDN